MKAAVTLLLLPLALLLIPTSHATSTTTVTINGVVSVDGVTVTVRADASAPGCLIDCAASLSGSGTDSPPPGPSPAGNPGVCHFPLTGSVSGSTVTLSGAVAESSNPALVGTAVGIHANASSGAITFIFGSFTLSGMGTVVIRIA